MSSVGRIFVVLNLLLAGAFVGFAGTYLQKATDWKQKHDTVKEESAAEIARKDAEISAQQSKVADKDTQLATLQSNLGAARAENESLKAENGRQEERLTQLQASYTKMSGDYSTISSSIDRATADAKDARERAIAAQGERDDAVRAQEKAEANLRDANDMIASLNTTIGEKDASLAEASATIRQNEMLIAIAQQRGFTIEGAQPNLEGSVIHVGLDGRILTVAVNASDYEPKPGYQFAIFDPKTKTYKGEARITEVDGRNAFCRVISPVAGASINVGDSADTQTGF